jgi:hypothetical protein
VTYRTATLIVPLLIALTACGATTSTAGVDRVAPWTEKVSDVVALGAPGDRPARHDSATVVRTKQVRAHRAAAPKFGAQGANRKPQGKGRPDACNRPTPTTAAGWKATFGRLGGKLAIGDQSTSLRLPDGRTMWLFDDTIQGTLTKSGGVKNWRMPHSTIGLTERGCASIHTGPSGRSVIPEARDGDYYWPQSAVVDGGKLYIFSMRIKPVQESFAGTGMELAEMRYAHGGVPSFARMHRTPATMTPETAVQWGVSTTKDAGYTYVYGTRKVAKPSVFGRAMYVARVPAGQLTRLSSWRYWNGTTWATSGAKEIHPAVGGVSTSVSAHKLAGRWVIVTKKDDFLGEHAIALSGPTPAGPFTEHVLVRTPSNVDTGDVTYSVMAHPHLPTRSGKLLISVCRNNLQLDRVTAEVERGRPYFLEVALPQ